MGEVVVVISGPAGEEMADVVRREEKISLPITRSSVEKEKRDDMKSGHRIVLFQIPAFLLLVELVSDGDELWGERFVVENACI